MSCIATFHVLPESKRPEFTDAHRNQKQVTYKKTLFGKKEIVTGDKYLWEYLNEAATKTEDLPFSGFAIVEYLFTYVELPEALNAELEGASIDDYYTALSANLAGRLAEHLETHTPTVETLTAFAAEEWPKEKDSEQTGRVLREVHDHLVTWFRSVGPNEFGVLHLSF